MTDEPEYDFIAEAEAAIQAAGYQRDRQRHIWTKPGAVNVKVVRKDNLKFVVRQA